MRKRLISVCTIIILISIICLYAWESRHAFDAESGDMTSEDAEKFPKSVCDDPDMQYVYEKIESIDFSVQEYSIDTKVYDTETDKEYKNAYLSALLNKIPIHNEEIGGYYFKWESDTHPEIMSIFLCRKKVGRSEKS